MAKNCDLSRRQLFRLTGMGIGASAMTGLGMIGTGISPAHAKKGQWFTPYNTTGVPRSFRQGNGSVDNAKGVPNYSNISVPTSGGINLAKSGCAVFAALNLYIKSGSRGGNYSMMDFLDENDTALKKGPAVTTSEGLLSWGTAGLISQRKKDSGYFEFVKEASASGDSSSVKKYYEQGYMMLIGVMGTNGTRTGHWVCVDYIKDGKVRIIDSGSGCEYLEDAPYSGKTGPIKLYQAYDKSGKKVKVGDLPKTTEWTKPGKGGSGGDDKKDDKDKDKGKDDSGGGETYQRLSEEDLEGMESYKKQKEWADEFGTQSSDIGIPPQLTDEEEYNLETLRDNIESQKKSPTDWANQGVVFASLLGMMYSVILFFAYLFDVSNNFTEGSLMRGMTAGKLTPVYDKSDRGKYDGSTHVTMSGAFKYSLIGILFCLILVSGVFFGWFEAVIGFLADNFG